MLKLGRGGDFKYVDQNVRDFNQIVWDFNQNYRDFDQHFRDFDQNLQISSTMFEILSKKFEIYEITPSQSRFFLQIACYYRVGTVWTVWRKTTNISQKTIIGLKSWKRVPTR